MKKKTVIVLSLLAALLILGMGACLSNGGADAHSSKEALDWDGVYTGTTPAADAEGIAVRLRLNRDGTFEKSIQYLGKSSNVYNEAGTFKWNKAGDTVILDIKDAPPYYKVVEGALIQLDMKGKRITGEFADMYVLKKLLAN